MYVWFACIRYRGYINIYTYTQTYKRRDSAFNSIVEPHKAVGLKAGGAA